MAKNLPRLTVSCRQSIQIFRRIRNCRCLCAAPGKEFGHRNGGGLSRAERQHFISFPKDQPPAVGQRQKAFSQGWVRYKIRGAVKLCVGNIIRRFRPDFLCAPYGNCIVNFFLPAGIVQQQLPPCSMGITAFFTLFRIDPADRRIQRRPVNWLEQIGFCPIFDGFLRILEIVIAA